MDILHKELNYIYTSQHLDDETLDPSVLNKCIETVYALTSLNNACAIITNVAADKSVLLAGSLAKLIGLTESATMHQEINSSDEDLIYTRLHPEDLVEKRMLEYDFFKLINPMDANDKVHYKASCRIRIKDFNNNYRIFDNSTQLLMPSPKGKIWLVLCCYDLSPEQSVHDDINPCIINNDNGKIINISYKEKRRRILSEREKEILILIKNGKPSKLIADILGISIHTVNRHRQNILEKLSVGNSIEAVTAATAMKLL